MSTWTNLQLEGRVKVIHRSRAVAWLWISVGYAIALFAFMLTSVILGALLEKLGQKGVIAVPLVLFFIVLTPIARGFRYLSLNARDLLENDPRPPILYLHSFQDDETFFGGKESALCQVLGECGPVIAIGKPNERLPSFGAGRLYVDNTHWQDVIRHLLQHVRFVVLRFGLTEGLWWELDLVAKSIPQEKILIFLPWDSYSQQQAIWSSVGIGSKKSRETLFLKSYEAQYGMFRAAAH